MSSTRRIVDLTLALESEGMIADQAFAVACQRVSVSPSAVELARSTVDLARKILAALDAELAEARRIERDARNAAARGAR